MSQRFPLIHLWEEPDRIKPPDIEIILDDPESLNYINGRPDPISNESKSLTAPCGCRDYDMQCSCPCIYIYIQRDSK